MFPIASTAWIIAITFGSALGRFPNKLILAAFRTGDSDSGVGGLVWVVEVGIGICRPPLELAPPVSVIIKSSGVGGIHLGFVFRSTLGNFTEESGGSVPSAGQVYII